MSLNTVQFSVLLNQAMDCLGYSLETIEMRAAMDYKWFEIINERVADDETENILAGGRSEGTSSCLGGDIDVMAVFKNCICVEDGYHENGIYVVQHSNDTSPPGYTRLRPVNFDDGTPFSLRISTVYDPNTDRTLLSSAIFQQNISLFHKLITILNAIKLDIKVSGPAVNMSYNNVFANMGLCYVSFDLVHAIRFYSKSILKEWQERKREHHWPSRTIIKEVSSSEGYVVPVGPIFSEEQDTEWRICFTTAERLLILSLKEVPKKLYVILKILNKHVFNPNVDCISSYMLKNVILWIAECTPENAFTPCNLIQMLMKCLVFLLHCLNNNFLPNYMIPRRNLFLGKVKSEHKHQLRLVLRKLLKERERVVLRCRKILVIMHETIFHPPCTSIYRMWRDEIEWIFCMFSLLFVEKGNIFATLLNGGISNVVGSILEDEIGILLAERLGGLLSMGVNISIYDLQNIFSLMKELFSF